MDEDLDRKGGQGREVPGHVKKVVDAVTELAKPIVESIGCEIDRVTYRDAGRRAHLQVFIDKAGGVGVDDCSQVSRQLSATLDVHDVVPRAFVLEVSSPGLDRPLEGEGDFRRFAGRPASITCRRAIEGGSKVVGTLRGVDDGAVVIETKDGRPVRIPLELVAKARLEVDLEGTD